jgi:hypothetical protein
LEGAIVTGLTGEGTVTAVTTKLIFPDVTLISGFVVVEVAFILKDPISTPEEFVTLTEKFPSFKFSV